MSHELRRAPGDIKPTMTDQDVLDFCKKGLFVLEGVIPDRTNHWVSEYLDQEGNDSQTLLEEERFIEDVLLQSRGRRRRKIAARRAFSTAGLDGKPPLSRAAKNEKLAHGRRFKV